MNRRDFQKLDEARLLDARALLRAKRYDAARYMAGYAVECALKACIARKTRRFDFPPREAARFYIHELEPLVKSAQIEEAFKQDRLKDSALDDYWAEVKDWDPALSRYALLGSLKGAEKAKKLIRAIDDKQHGVLQCLSKYW